MATRSELRGRLLAGGVTPFDRITNQEAARLSAGHASLRNMLERAKMAREGIERSRKAAAPSICRMLRLTLPMHAKGEPKSLRWS